MSRTRIQAAIEQIEQSRLVTLSLLEGLTPSEWFWSPAGSTSHVAWQVGHLATTQYVLCLRRVRGRVEADDDLAPEEFLARFARGSQPVAGAAGNPPADGIESIFDGIFRQSLRELADQTDEQLDVPLAERHPMFSTNLEAIEFCPLHECMHAGQIGLLRRLMGKQPLR